MASIIVQVAEGVRSAIQDGLDNDAFIVTGFVPERSYADWDIELEAVGELHVDVVAVTGEIGSEFSTGESIAYTVPVDIGVRKRLESQDQEAHNDRVINEAVDELVELTEQIHEYFHPQERSGEEPGRLPAYEEAVFTGAAIRTVANRQHLHAFRQFTGIVRVTYRVDKTIGS